MKSVLTILLIVIFSWSFGQFKKPKGTPTNGEVQMRYYEVQIEEEYYFPRIPEANKFLRHGKIDSTPLAYESLTLHRMGEPIIYNKNTEGERFRLTWIRSFHPPIVITIVNCDRNYFKNW